uniref:Uncharacterized protein n=1 Tax=Salarias fasciatus TaxID=181472 RepID=A0A672IG04_SALFA
SHLVLSSCIKSGLRCSSSALRPGKWSAPAACPSCCRSAAPGPSPAGPSSPGAPPACPPSEHGPLLHTDGLSLHPAGLGTGSPPRLSPSAVYSNPERSRSQWVYHSVTNAQFLLYMRG